MSFVCLQSVNDLGCKVEMIQRISFVLKSARVFEGYVDDFFHLINFEANFSFHLNTLSAKCFKSLKLSIGALALVVQPHFFPKT